MKYLKFLLNRKNILKNWEDKENLLHTKIHALYQEIADLRIELAELKKINSCYEYESDKYNHLKEQLRKLI